MGLLETADCYSVPGSAPSVQPIIQAAPPNQATARRESADFRRSRQPIRPNNTSAAAALDGSGTGTISPIVPLTNVAVPRSPVPAPLKKRI